MDGPASRPDRVRGAPPAGPLAGHNGLIGLLYDSIGKGYTSVRQEDPRIRARIHAALGDARTVVNVGAGAGSYEPADRDVVAVEPSETMIAQRPAGSAPVVRAYAEELPFEDGAFDAAMVVLSDHHWRDHARGLAELRRVARRVVIFGWDPATVLDMWIVRDYFPGVQELVPAGYRLAHTLARLGDARAEPVPIPHDCVDGFFHAYWRRPEAYLDEEVRAGISVFARMDRAAVERGVESLRRDLESGEWERRNGHLRTLDEVEAGYRLVISG